MATKETASNPIPGLANKTQTQAPTPAPLASPATSNPQLEREPGLQLKRTQQAEIASYPLLRPAEPLATPAPFASPTTSRPQFAPARGTEIKAVRSEKHTSELQSRRDLVCR